MKRSQGFTVIELIVVVVVLVAASVLIFTQKNAIESTARDNTRKTAINAMFFGLKEVYFKEHQSYPRTLTPETLPSVDPNLFTDPNGIKLGQTTTDINGQTYTVASNYRYEGTDCDETSCKNYTLRSTMENEDDFVRSS